MSKQFIFQMSKMSKVLPNGKTLLQDVNLSFYPGAKIGIIGENGAGKSTVLRIMAGVDPEFEGRIWKDPSAKVGYLAQEPTLEGETVDDAIAPAIAKSRSILDKFNDLSATLGDLEGEKMDEAMEELGRIQDQIDADLTAKYNKNP